MIIRRTTACPGLLTALVARCGRGDEAALGQLFDLVGTLVLAEVRMGDLDGDPYGADSAEADLLAVAAFRRVWLQSRRYDPESQGVVEWVLEQARFVSGPSDRPRTAAGRP